MSRLFVPSGSPVGLRPALSQPPVESAWLVGPADSGASVRASLPDEDAVLVGAHGGAGVSTLAGLLPTLVEAGEWPRDGSVPVVVVCRSNAAGLVAVGRLLDSHRVQPPLGVVMVADAPGRLPVALARRVRLLAAVTGVVWRVPWVEAWRRRGPSVPPPAGVARVLDQLVTAAREAAWA